MLQATTRMIVCSPVCMLFGNKVFVSELLFSCTTAYRVAQIPNKFAYFYKMN